MKRVLKRSVIAAEIYDIIKEQILDHTLAPGEKANIDQIARDLNVSNIPVREALQRLAAEGFIKMVPYKGMFVMSISLQEFDEIFEVRTHLETFAICKAMRRLSQEQLQKLDCDMKAWGKQNPVSTEEKLELISQINKGLHGMILRHCGNELLKQLVESFIERVSRYLALIQPEMTDDIIEHEMQEHGQVLDALIKGEQTEAVQAMKRHLNNSHERTRKYLDFH